MCDLVAYGGGPRSASDFTQRVRKVLRVLYRHGMPSLEPALRASGALLAGGFVTRAIVLPVRETVEDALYRITDLDVYVSSGAQAATLVRMLVEGGWSIQGSHTAPPYDDSFMRRNGIAARLSLSYRLGPSQSLAMDVMLVDAVLGPTPLDVVQNFDLTCCEVWYDGETVVAKHPTHLLPVRNNGGDVEYRCALNPSYLPPLVRGNNFLRKRLHKYSRLFDIDVRGTVEAVVSSKRRRRRTAKTLRPREIAASHLLALRLELERRQNNEEESSTMPALLERLGNAPLREVATEGLVDELREKIVLWSRPFPGPRMDFWDAAYNVPDNEDDDDVLQRLGGLDLYRRQRFRETAKRVREAMEKLLPGFQGAIQEGLREWNARRQSAARRQREVAPLRMLVAALGLTSTDVVTVLQDAPSLQEAVMRIFVDLPADRLPAPDHVAWPGTDLDVFDPIMLERVALSKAAQEEDSIVIVVRLKSGHMSAVLADREHLFDRERLFVECRSAERLLSSSTDTTFFATWYVKVFGENFNVLLEAAALRRALENDDEYRVVVAASEEMVNVAAVKDTFVPGGVNAFGEGIDLVGATHCNQDEYLMRDLSVAHVRDEDT